MRHLCIKLFTKDEHKPISPNMSVDMSGLMGQLTVAE